MPISYTLDEARGVVITTWSGMVTMADQEAHWRALLADSAARQSGRSVVDIRNGTPLFTGDEMRRGLATVVAPMLGPTRWISAIVVANALQFGVSRQFEVFADSLVHGEIFEDLQAALDWVASQ